MVQELKLGELIVLGEIADLLASFTHSRTPGYLEQ
jgi:hypothetical protein